MIIGRNCAGPFDVLHGPDEPAVGAEHLNAVVPVVGHDDVIRWPVKDDRCGQIELSFLLSHHADYPDPLPAVGVQPDAVVARVGHGHEVPVGADGHILRLIQLALLNDDPGAGLLQPAPDEPEELVGRTGGVLQDLDPVVARVGHVQEVAPLVHGEPDRVLEVTRTLTLSADGTGENAGFGVQDANVAFSVVQDEGGLFALVEQDPRREVQIGAARIAAFDVASQSSRLIENGDGFPIKEYDTN